MWRRKAALMDVDDACRVLGDLRPAEVNDLESVRPQYGVAAKLVARPERIGVFDRPVDLDDGAVLLPVEIDTCSWLGRPAQPHLQSGRRQSAVPEHYPARWTPTATPRARRRTPRLLSPAGCRCAAGTQPGPTATPLAWSASGAARSRQRRHRPGSPGCGPGRSRSGRASSTACPAAPSCGRLAELRRAAGFLAGRAIPAAADKSALPAGTSAPAGRCGAARRLTDG